MTESKRRAFQWIKGFFQRANAAGVRIDPLDAREQAQLGVTKADVIAAENCQHLFPLPKPEPLSRDAECA